MASRSRPGRIGRTAFSQGGLQECVAVVVTVCLHRPAERRAHLCWIRLLSDEVVREFALVILDCFAYQGSERAGGS